jgi:hypothetical protein
MSIFALSNTGERLERRFCVMLLSSMNPAVSENGKFLIEALGR